MSTATRRLMKEYSILKKKPVDNIIARPSTNVHKWYFMLHSLDGDYKDGLYIGKIVFPSNYPFSPPDVIFLTPNGRFETNKKICLSFTSYHPESWNPSWNMSNMLIGLISFMYENTATTGGLNTSGSAKRRYARRSIAFNLSVPEFKDLFLDDIMRLKIDLDKASENNSAELRVTKGLGEAILDRKATIFAFLILIIAIYIGFSFT